MWLAVPAPSHTRRLIPATTPTRPLPRHPAPQPYINKKLHTHATGRLRGSHGKFLRSVPAPGCEARQRGVCGGGRAAALLLPCLLCWRQLSCRASLCLLPPTTHRLLLRALPCSNAEAAEQERRRAAEPADRADTCLGRQPEHEEEGQEEPQEQQEEGLDEQEQQEQEEEEGEGLEEEGGSEDEPQEASPAEARAQQQQQQQHDPADRS